MSERVRTRQRSNMGAAAPQDDAGPGPDVLVTTGLYADSLPVAGNTVAEVRRRFADRLNIDPLATAVLDGHAADESSRLRAGQVLSFVRAAGEKGTSDLSVSDEITIRGATVEARSPEGATATMALADLLEALRPDLPSTAGLVWPDGVRMSFSIGRVTVFVWEIPPGVHRVNWICGDSPAPCRLPGRTATYQPRRLALPYLVIFAVFDRARGGRLVLSNNNELYFRTAPVTGPDDQLCFPALLNISNLPRCMEASRPLAWICTQYLDRGALASEPDDNRRFRKSLEALRSTLLEAAFNYSSEEHDLTSYWTLSAQKIPQVADLDRWEKLSLEDPLFVLEVPWLPAQLNGKALTIGTLAQRIIRAARAPESSPLSAAGLARIVFNHAGTRPCQSTAAGS